MKTSHSPLPWDFLLYYTMILQRIRTQNHCWICRIRTRDLFCPPVVCCATNEPPHLHPIFTCVDPDPQSSWIRIQYGSGSTTLVGCAIPGSGSYPVCHFFSVTRCRSPDIFNSQWLRLLLKCEYCKCSVVDPEWFISDTATNFGEIRIWILPILFIFRN